MPRLSIVIPCIQDARRFEATLASVLQNRPDDCEVLVVQPRSYDDPYELKDEVRFLEAPSDSTTVDLMNLGIQVAEGPVIHVLSCDVEVTDGWAEPVLEHFIDPMVCAVSPRLVRHNFTQQVVARGVYYTSGGTRKVRVKRASRWRSRCGHILGPTLDAGFYRRQAVLEAGGFCSSVGKPFADVEMGLALRAAGLCAINEDESVVKIEREGEDRSLSFRRGRQAERLFWRRAAQFGWVRSLVMHTGSVMAELILNVHRPSLCLQLLGRALTTLEFASRFVSPRRTGTFRPRSDRVEQGLVPFRAVSDAEADRQLNRRAAA